ncbi:universal stress protein [Streptomyces sp. CRN 30]|uniref:universal stress protein n=1 Tax=Streptomyces sp. CRN 30 TaxID=3075613 RepID=UPI002A7FFC3F|nr:universal stress protein [Streptomyces sp. CRN 30]
MQCPVLTGVDGSAESLAAAAWAAREAKRREAPLSLLHVRAWSPQEGGNEPDSAVQRFLARRCLRQAEERIRADCPDVRIDADQVDGPATQALLATAERCDLLVLGSRGLGGIAGFLVGSVSFGVVARSVRPVVLVRAGEDAADEHLPAPDGTPSARTGYRDVVLGVDPADPRDEVMEFAFHEARLRRARLQAVYAWQEPGPLTLGPGEVGLMTGTGQAREWREFLSGVLQPWREKYPDVEVRESAAEGRPAGALIAAATGAGLLVVGHRLTDRPLGPRTGPVTHAAIHHAGCPVAVVPHT